MSVNFGKRLSIFSTHWQTVLLIWNTLSESAVKVVLGWNRLDQIPWKSHVLFITCHCMKRILEREKKVDVWWTEKTEVKNPVFGSGCRKLRSDRLQAEKRELLDPFFFKDAHTCQRKTYWLWFHFGLVFKQVSWNSELHLLGTGQEDSSNDGGLVIVDDAHTIFPPGMMLKTDWLN